MPKFKDDDEDSLPAASRLSHSLDDEERVDLEGEVPGALRDEEDPWEDPNAGSILARRGQSLFDEIVDDEEEDLDDDDLDGEEDADELD